MEVHNRGASYTEINQPLALFYEIDFNMWLLSSAHNAEGTLSCVPEFSLNQQIKNGIHSNLSQGKTLGHTRNKEHRGQLSGHSYEHIFTWQQ